MRSNKTRAAILLALSVLVLSSCTGEHAAKETDTGSNTGTETAEKAGTDTETQAVTETGTETVSDMVSEKVTDAVTESETKELTAKGILLSGYWVCEEMGGLSGEELFEEYNMPLDCICTMRFLDDGRIHMIMYGFGMTAEYSMEDAEIKMNLFDSPLVGSIDNGILRMYMPSDSDATASDIAVFVLRQMPDAPETFASCPSFDFVPVNNTDDEVTGEITEDDWYS